MSAQEISPQGDPGQATGRVMEIGRCHGKEGEGGTKTLTWTLTPLPLLWQWDAKSSAWEKRPITRTRSRPF